MNESSKRSKPITLDTFWRGVWKENPVFVMVLGLCPALAVTNTTFNALGMMGCRSIDWEINSLR